MRAALRAFCRRLTPLLLAAANGHAAVAELLILHGADVHAMDKVGCVRACTRAYACVRVCVRKYERMHSSELFASVSGQRLRIEIGN